jgi:hypothetical protein
LFLGVPREILVKEVLDIELVDLHNPVLSLADEGDLLECLFVHIVHVNLFLQAGVC